MPGSWEQAECVLKAILYLTYLYDLSFIPLLMDFKSAIKGRLTYEFLNDKGRMKMGLQNKG